MKKPKVLVFSSSESLPLAEAVQLNLEHQAEVTVWSQGIFELSRYTLESLLDALDEANAAVFIFSPEDVVEIRGESQTAARDNVVFELGLGIGRLGRDRSFLIMPRKRLGFRLPTDLVGLTPGEFDAERQDGNLRAALGPVCSMIATQLNALFRVVYPPRARNGPNILAPALESFRSEERHSFAALVPPQGALRIVLQKTGSPGPGWGYSASSAGLWHVEPLDTEIWRQVFELKGGQEGDLNFTFQGSGHARLSYFEHGSSEPTHEKDIRWS